LHNNRGIDITPSKGTYQKKILKKIYLQEMLLSVFLGIGILGIPVLNRIVVFKFLFAFVTVERILCFASPGQKQHKNQKGRDFFHR
jgi:hypothetical protein